MLQKGVYMPEITFKCTTCGTLEKRIVKLSDVPPIGQKIIKFCNKCEGYGAKRIIDGAPRMKMGKSISKQRKEFDGFGWHDGLNMSFKGPKDYKAYLKRENLIEAGNEAPPQYKDPEVNLIDDQLLADAAKAGIKVSGQEAEALKSGKYQKSEEFKKEMSKISPYLNKAETITSEIAAKNPEKDEGKFKIKKGQKASQTTQALTFSS